MSYDEREAVVLQIALQKMFKSKDVVRDTHGNVSSRDKDTVFIKPSGIPYETIELRDISVVCFDGDGNQVKLAGRKPSVDLVHHWDIYRNHPEIGAICHTHSPYATAFAMANKMIECCCTEQADYFGHDIVCAPYADLNLWGKTLRIPKGDKAILLGNHGCLTFAEDPVTAVNLAVQLENVAQKTYLAMTLSHSIRSLSADEVEKWHRRYTNDYGQ